MVIRICTVAAVAFATAVASAPGASAGELVNDSISFAVPAIGVPTVACVTINGQKTCNPAPSTNAITATVSATVTEGNSLAVTEGAPATRASGENCGRLAKTVTVALAFGSQARVAVVGTTPGIDKTIDGPAVPGALQHNSVEICVNE